MHELNRLRIRGVLMLTMLGWTSTACILLLSLLFGLVSVGLGALGGAAPA